MKKLIIIFILLFVSISFAEDKRFTVPTEDSPSCGSPGAAVVLIEFLDYQ